MTTPTRITGKIVSASTPGMWIVKDDSGRRHRAASPDFWRRGARVVIVGGQIIDHASKPKTQPIFEV